MGQAATKAQEAHAKHKCKPKVNKKTQNQKLAIAQKTGLLALAQCKLTKVPSELLLQQPTNEFAGCLRTLDLSGNRIKELPVQINQLQALKILKLNSNQLETLPELTALVNLQTLVADDNALVSIQKLPPQLTKLSLAGNQLQQIPRVVTQLTQLVHLDLSRNQIASIPDQIALLQELVELVLDGNLLTELPKSLALCVKLQVVSAKTNRFRVTKGKPQCISFELLAESNVQILNLDGNNMTKFDLEAMEGIDKFLQRRKTLKNKEIHGGLSTDVSLCGLD